MNKLLSAGFVRLKKDKFFWIGVAAMFIIGLFIPLETYRNMVRFDYNVPPEDGLFSFAPFIGVLCAAFCSLFLGTEYSDGTIRNKLIVGHRRTDIYLSGLIVVTSAVLIMCLAFIIPALVLGLALQGNFELELKYVALMLLTGLLLSIVFSSVCVMVSMLNQNKAVVAVACLIGFFILLFAGAYINSRLLEPPVYDNYAFMDESGNIQLAESEPNPSYLEEPARGVYEFFLDLLPTGQALQLASLTAERLPRMALCSLGLILLTTGLGLCFFRKKDIK